MIRNAAGVLSLAGCAAALSSVRIIPRTGVDYGCGKVGENPNPYCGADVEEPCPIFRNFNDTCGDLYELGFQGRKMYGEVVGPVNDTTKDLEITEWGFYMLCPFQCADTFRCVTDPETCPNKKLVPDYIMDGAVMPGSSYNQTVAIDVQWRQILTNLEPTGEDTSDAIDQLNNTLPYAGRIKPYAFTALSRVCDGVAYTQEMVMDTTCGSDDNPCIVASTDDRCGKAYRLKISVGGINDNALCPSGTCEPYLSTKSVIVAAKRDYPSEALGFQASAGLWNSLCPAGCGIADTDTSICTPTAEVCGGTILPNVTVPAFEGWDAYTLPGSISVLTHYASVYNATEIDSPNAATTIQVGSSMTLLSVVVALGLLA